MAASLTGLNIELFGDFRIFKEGTPIDLPPSKKARALLAYLIVSNRPQRREHLCEMFWETPNDPKGALRWALSKLRRSFNDTDGIRLEADRERVSFDLIGIETETAQINALIQSQASTKDVFLTAKAKLDRDFLGGLELSNLNQYSLWLTEQREYVQRLKGSLIEQTIKCHDIFPEEEIQLSREWLSQQPYSTSAAKNLISVLMRQNAVIEAKTITDDLTTRFKEAGIDFNLESFTPTASAVMLPMPVAAPSLQNQNAEREQKLLSRQRIQFCKTETGVNLAYASVGSGPPLVKAANWLTHLELDWSAPIWSPLYRELAQDFTFIRYDERGNGLSDWDVDELSQETFVKDLECVVDNMGLEKFPLLGISQGAAVSIDYAVRHPERVSKLILFGGYAKGWRVDASPETIMQREAMITLTKTGWGQNNPAYRHVFSSTFMPTASPEDLAWFDDFQRQTTSPDNAVKFLQAFADIDVRAQLSKITVPTLVIHSRGDQRIDWQVGRDIAAEIPNAELVTLDSDNHLLLEGEPAATQFIRAVKDFLAK